MPRRDGSPTRGERRRARWAHAEGLASAPAADEWMLAPSPVSAPRVFARPLVKAKRRATWLTPTICHGPAEHQHAIKCRPGRPACRWRRQQVGRQTCDCPAYRFPHATGKGQCNPEKRNASMWGPSTEMAAARSRHRARMRRRSRRTGRR